MAVMAGLVVGAAVRANVVMGCEKKCQRRLASLAMIDMGVLGRERLLMRHPVQQPQ